MRNLSRSIVGLGRRFISAPPRWCPSAVARRDAPLKASPSTDSDLHLDRLSRSWNMLPHSRIPFACATTRCTNTTKMSTKATKKITDANPYITEDGIWLPTIYENSSHRDGSIYKNADLKEEWFDVDITDRNETRLEPMMLSKATEMCSYNGEYCLFHFEQDMLQFFSVTLAESPIRNGSIQLYGYIAVRDERDGMLNYVVNHIRDDPIIAQQGSLIEMTGPKRGIYMGYPVLIEFDIKIKNGGQEEDDLELIDGAIACRYQRPQKPLKHRITGKCGTVDISLAYIEYAVEATIEVFISEVQRGFSLSLCSLVYVVDDYEHLPLFHGTIDEPCDLRRFVVAVTLGTQMLLNFKVDNNNDGRCHSFKALQHGCASQQLKLELASVDVKVTWSTIWNRHVSSISV